MIYFTQFLVGLVFGLGLVISNLSDPDTIIGFLDVTGAWNPVLLATMAGAVVTAFVGYRLVLRRPQPLLSDRFRLPGRTDIDARLIVGAAIFGVGWGLAGICPGPAQVNVALLDPFLLLFVAAMAVGIMIARGVTAVQRRLRLAGD